MSKNQISEVNYETFEGIKHVDELGNEYWLVRELQVVVNILNEEILKKSLIKQKSVAQLVKKITITILLMSAKS